MPYALATITPFESKDEIDSGDYRVTLDRCLAEFGWAEKSKLQGRLIDGRYHGLAVGCFIEGGAAGPKETARLEIDAGRLGVGVHGLLGGRPGRRDGVRPDRGRCARNPDRAHRRRLPRLDRLCERRLRRLSFALGGDGRLGPARCGEEPPRSDPRRGGEALGLRAGGDQDHRGQDRRARTARRSTFAAFAGLSAEGIFLNKKHTYTYGAHAAHVTVDARTGEVEIVDYLTVVDCGRIINPMTVRGQVIGSLVQGLGGAMLENLVYDDEGQLLTGIARRLPAADRERLSQPARHRHRRCFPPRSIRSAPRARARAASSPPAASWPTRSPMRSSAFGVEPRELPLTPPKIWEMVQAGRNSRIVHSGARAAGTRNPDDFARCHSLDSGFARRKTRAPE